MQNYSSLYTFNFALLTFNFVCASNNDANIVLLLQ